MANAQESELNYVFGDTLPAIGRTLPVAEGVRWLRMRLPFALDHINLWLLRDHEDTPEAGAKAGPSSTAASTTPARAPPGSRSSRPSCRACRCCASSAPTCTPTTSAWRTGSPNAWHCRLWISATDWNAARVASAAVGDAHSGHGAADFFARHGLTDAAALAQGARALQLLRQHGAAGAGAVPPADARHAAAHRRRTTGSASPATAMRRSTSRCTAPRWAR